ncbi:alpha/beta hydrolase [Schaalia sp. ZJ1691]|uniref:alpha/beta hydrolase n=1 Tax=Schaalia sp. ZJ1691 TaxID=2709404 RepID=UPI0013ECD4A7|nr:alpha/beta hydrolase [Schaalia sp. ZJ1691]
MSEPIDVLAPWGDAGPAPVNQWRHDILGAAFESRTIELLPDAEGDNVATLVRYLPHRDPASTPQARSFPRFAALYIHGRNDYFFQTELARSMADSGAAFYALDLRKYGRSLRPWQTIGYTDDLNTYDEEIGESLDIIRSEQGDLPLVIVAHSTGGLIATLWAHRHPGALGGLILNSAWLEMQTLANLRSTIQPVLGQIAYYSPMWPVPMGSGPDFYARSLVDGWSGSGLTTPPSFSGNEDDPAFTGWDYAHEWKRPGSYPAQVSWLDAVLRGHEVVNEGVDISCPVLSMTSSGSYFGEQWDEQVFTCDVVLDVEVIAKRAATLGPLVTVAHFPGKHDLFLSDPWVRADVYSLMRRWCGAFVAAE